MRKFVAILVVCTLSACSGGGSLGNLNLFGWLGGGGAQNSQLGGRGLAPRGGFTQQQETRPLVAQITGLVVDHTATGAIVRATASVPSEGYHSAELVLSDVSERGLAVYDFRAGPPNNVHRAAPAHLREIVAAVHLTQGQLSGIRRIQVRGSNNNRTANR